MKLDVEFRDRDGAVRVERIEVQGRRQVDFMASDAEGFLQIAKFVHDEAGAPQGIYVGGPDTVVAWNYADGRRVTVREANEDANIEYRLLPRVVLPFQIKIPAGVLRLAETDAIMLLRAGSAANALQTILESHGELPTKGARGLVDQRNLIHLTIIIASYIRELAQIVNDDKSHAGRLWSLAERGIGTGRQLPPAALAECRTLLAPHGRFLVRLVEIRNRLGFHLIPPEFKAWLQGKPADEEVVLEAVPEPSRPDVIFVASLQATADACRQPDDRQFFVDATSLAITLPYVIEAATMGLLAEHGFDPHRFAAYDVNAVFEGRASWEQQSTPAAE
jgi:hypothetical protein